MSLHALHVLQHILGQSDKYVTPVELTPIIDVQM